MSDRLIIAIGNPLRGDDGIAARVVAELGEYLAASDVLVVQQLTIELAPILAEHAHVLFVDASVTLPPGDFDVRPLIRPAESSSPFAHDLEPEELITMAHSFFGSRTRGALLSIGAADLELPDHISSQLLSNLPRYATAVLDWYREPVGAECGSRKK